MTVYAILDHELATNRPITMSLWSTKTKAQKALARYLDVPGFVSERAEIIAIKVDSDAFTESK